MTTMRPYEAWFFFGADNIDEVNAEYKNMVDGAERGAYLVPDLAAHVTVVAGEMRHAMEYVWIVRDGLLECRESWKVRRADWL